MDILAGSVRSTSLSTLSSGLKAHGLMAIQAHPDCWVLTGNQSMHRSRGGPGSGPEPSQSVRIRALPPQRRCRLNIDFDSFLSGEDTEFTSFAENILGGDVDLEARDDL